ncbi:hypothetical protein B0T19DRAFT_44239 [Cercophora scortea]|uniref:Uncharacterized protein n=1 Tax=Cercophora scortea TaxID=314031 RepID=A0AAE0J4T3_9PEZI|nr:hypothetical protein B0T19DRAFT_44239 [Cercophora scortea]
MLTLVCGRGERAVLPILSLTVCYIGHSILLPCVCCFPSVAFCCLLKKRRKRNHCSGQEAGYLLWREAEWNGWVVGSNTIGVHIHGIPQWSFIYMAMRTEAQIAMESGMEGVILGIFSVEVSLYKRVPFLGRARTARVNSLPTYGTTKKQYNAVLLSYILHRPTFPADSDKPLAKNRAVVPPFSSPS